MGDVLLDEDCFIIPFEQDNNSRAEIDIITCSHISADIGDGAALRRSAFDRTWRKIQHRVHGTVRQFSTSLSANIVAFIIQAYDYAEFGPPPLPIVPTAAIIGGSSSSRSVILDEAFTTYRSRESKTLYVSELHARDCSNLTSAMRCLILGFVGQVADDEEEDGEGGGASRLGGPTLANYDISLLEAWYRPLAKRRSPPKLVIVLSDFEAFDTTVLEELIYICSRRANPGTLPLVFVFGISTSGSYIHQNLSRKALTCLEMSTYSVTTGQELLQSVIEAIFFSPDFEPGVVFSPEALETLAKTYEAFGSLDAVQSAIELLLLRHFSLPLSVLTTSPISTSSISPSFRSHLRSKLVSSLDSLKLSDSDSEQIIQAVLAAKNDAGLLQAVESARSVFDRRVTEGKGVLGTIVKILNSFSGVGRSSRGGKAWSRWEVEGRLEEWLAIIDEKLRRKSTEDLLELLRTVDEHLEQSESEEEDPQTISMLGELREELAAVEIQLEQDQDLEVNGQDGSLARATGSSLMKRDARHDRLAGNVVEALTNFLRNHLFPMKRIPLHEVWYVGADGVDSIKELLSPSIRSTLISALLVPHAYLQCTCCKPTSAAEDQAQPETQAINTHPDASIAFSRYLNSGKLVNVYDWYETFAVVLEGEQDAVKAKSGAAKSNGRGKTRSVKQSEGADDDEEEAKKLEARFLRCFHEFDYLGLLRHSGRKLDHVMRTVYELVD